MTNDTAALKQFFTSASKTEKHVVVHYFYVKDEEVAASLAADASSRGFVTEVMPSGEGTGCCVTATHTLLLADDVIMTLRRDLEALARKHRGEYEGWEAES